MVGVLRIVVMDVPVLFCWTHTWDHQRALQYPLWADCWMEMQCLLQRNPPDPLPGIAAEQEEHNVHDLITELL